MSAVAAGPARMHDGRMQSFGPDSTDSFLALARAWAATVTVVTVRRHGEHVGPGAPELDGFTATAFLTVSMRPPIIAVSASSASSAMPMLRDCRSFAVNLLAADQAELATAFARTAGDRVALLAQAAWQPDAAGVPLLLGTAGGFSATVRQLIEAGDHTLVLGDVTAIHLGDRSDTLLYHDRAYARLTRADRPAD